MHTNILIYTTILGLLLFFYAFISKRKQLLTTLLRLEGLILIIFFILSYLRNTTTRFPLFILLFLCLVACEGALGLSILIRIVRSNGRDYYNSLNSLIC